MAEAVEGFGTPPRPGALDRADDDGAAEEEGAVSTGRCVKGLYGYAPRTAHGTAVRQMVRNFVDRTLDGSITPFVAYLAEREPLTEEEIEELEALLTKLQRDRQKKR